MVISIVMKEAYTYHKGCQVVLVSFSGFPQLFDVNVSFSISSNSNDFHSAHGSTSWVCPVCRNRYDAHISVMIPSWLHHSFTHSPNLLQYKFILEIGNWSQVYHMICTDNHKLDILASSTSIRLQWKRVETSDSTQELTQVRKHFLHVTQSQFMVQIYKQMYQTCGLTW